MSEWHRDNPELMGTEADPWMGNADYRAIVAVSRGPASVFADCAPAGCRCDAECEFPCWQRVGLTSSPCCPECAPLDAEDVERVDA